jgi:hypothetical protein
MRQVFVFEKIAVPMSPAVNPLAVRENPPAEKPCEMPSKPGCWVKSQLTAPAEAGAPDNASKAVVASNSLFIVFS